MEQCTVGQACKEDKKMQQRPDQCHLVPRNPHCHPAGGRDRSLTNTPSHLFMGVAGPQHAIGVGLGSRFSPCTLRVPEIKLRWSGLVASKQTYLDGHWEGNLVL